MANIFIGSARIDELGNISGGESGDQKQVIPSDSTFIDFIGEVSVQPLYLHSKGWIVLRLKDAEDRKRIADAMQRACNNKNIGYDQSARMDILGKGTGSKQATECDCSSLVRQCFIEATEFDPGNFTTYNEKIKLVATKLVDVVGFDENELLTGDILVTKTKGHTAIVVQGIDFLDYNNDGVVSDGEEQDYITSLAYDVIKGKFGSGATRKARLNHLLPNGYKLVQARVNEILNSK